MLMYIYVLVLGSPRLAGLATSTFFYIQTLFSCEDHFSGRKLVGGGRGLMCILILLGKLAHTLNVNTFILNFEIVYSMGLNNDNERK